MAHQHGGRAALAAFVAWLCEEGACKALPLHIVATQAG